MEQTVQRERKIRIIPATKPVSAPGRASGSKQDKLSFSTAADYIAILTEQEQTILASVMDKLGVIPTRSQLVKIKEQRRTEVLTITVIEAILSEECPATVQVVLKQTRLRQYFPQTYTAQQMEEVIVSLLETWSVQHK